MALQDIHYHENTPLQRIYTSSSLVWCRDLDVLSAKNQFLWSVVSTANTTSPLQQHVSNHEVRRHSDCIPASKIIQSRRLKLFGHIARADVELDHHRALRAAIRSPPPVCRRPPERPRQTWTRTIETDLRPMSIGLHSAWCQAQDRTSHYLEETHEDSPGICYWWWW